MSQSISADLFEIPDDRQLSTDTSWQRAQLEDDNGSWINDAERMVWLEDSDHPHRVVFVLAERTLRCHCSCSGYQYRDWCAHVASCWWDWINDDLSVSHIHTGRVYDYPPDWLRLGDDSDHLPENLSRMQLDAYLHCELGNTGPSQWASHTDRAKGTVGNQLANARQKLSGGHE